MTARLRAICTVLLTVGVLAQLLAGQALMLVSPGWLVSPPPSWPDAAVTTPYMDFVRANLPPGQVLVLSAPAGSADQYFRLSYGLAGRNQVYFVEPATTAQRPLWWQPSYGNAADLEGLARRYRAAYVAFDGLEPPPNLSLQLLLRFGTGQSLARLAPA